MPDDQQPRYPRFVIETHERFPWTGDDPEGEPVTVRAMFVQIEADESTNITMIPPQNRQPPDITQGNYSIAIDAIVKWCRSRPFEPEQPVPTFDDMMASDGKSVIINLRRL